jgi:glycine hydroxymethyltransferase
LGLTGNKVEKVLDMVHITTNKNSLPGDVSAVNPGGVRLGTPALTSRGLNQDDFIKVAEYLHRGCEIAQRAQEIARDRQGGSGKVLLKDFLAVFESNEEIQLDITTLK